MAMKNTNFMSSRFVLHWCFLIVFPLQGHENWGFLDSFAGDLGQTAWSESTLQHVAGYDYDVLLFAGDLSYADYFQQKWDSFGQMMSPYAHYRPWMVTEGNHEMEYIPLLAPSFRSYNTRWDMPYAESGSTSNLYYSFDVASAHVLMLGSYTNFGVGSEQYNWLLVRLCCLSQSAANLGAVLWLDAFSFDPVCINCAQSIY